MVMKNNSREMFSEFGYYVFCLASSVLAVVNSQIIAFFVYLGLLASTFIMDLKKVDWIAIPVILFGLYTSVMSGNAGFISINILFLLFVLFRIFILERRNGKSAGFIVRRKSSAKIVRKLKLPSLDIPKWVSAPLLILSGLGVWYFASEIVRSFYPSMLLFLIAEGLFFYGIYSIIRGS